MFRFSFLLLFCFILVSACQKISEEPVILNNGAENSSAIIASSISVANVVVATQNGTVRYNVEIANTPEVREKGLQHREHLDVDWGMWFEFEEDSQNPFWMKNTPLSLDILFINSDFKVVDIAANAEPNSEELIVSASPFRYVLEVGAGQASENSVNIGDAVELRLGPQ